MRFGRVVLAVLVTAVVWGGCQRQTSPPASQPQDAAVDGAARSEPPDLEALRALPYVAGAEVGDEPDGIVWDDTDLSRAWPGYTLMSVHPRAEAILVDESGRTVRRWSDPRASWWAHVELLDNGDLIGTGAFWTQGALRRYAFRIAWDGTVLWRQRMLAHHDIIALPDGDLLTLVARRRVLPEVHRRIPVRDDQIVRLTAEGRTVWTISLYEVAQRSPGVFPLDIPSIEQLELEARARVDLFHANSVDWMRYADLARRDPLYAPQHVLVCMRHQNRVIVVDPERKQAVWAWGRGELDGPHDAQVLPNGHFLIFDNGLARGWSRVVELDPLARRIVWVYRDRQDPKRFYTASRGAAQRLPNGNTLVTESDRGHVFEVTADGQIVWRYYCPLRTPDRRRRGHDLRAAIERARRYDKAFIERLLAGGAQPRTKPASRP